MTVLRRTKRAIKKLLLGETTAPERFFVGMAEPQTEVTVWLQGMGKPLDVTLRHSMACAVPLIVCLAFDKSDDRSRQHLDRVSLEFRESRGEQRMLGEIELRYHSAIPHSQLQLMLFTVKKAANYCLPPFRLWMHYLVRSYAQWKGSRKADIRMSFLDKRAIDVLFICPRPVVLVSASDATGRNMFPMNVMGDLNPDMFAFALKDCKWPARLVERTCRVVLSSVPQAQGSYAYRIAANHNRESIDWYQLPFPTKPSSASGIPIPEFALRAREMEVEAVKHLGSHTFFIARVVQDERYAAGVELCVIHGFYQSWRMEHGVDRSASLAEHALVQTVAH
jgi:flavin reductase (DIM6/NTAB) family NADH-FMN oxidoreductase RutF